MKNKITPVRIHAAPNAIHIVGVAPNGEISQSRPQAGDRLERLVAVSFLLRWLKSLEQQYTHSRCQKKKPWDGKDEWHEYVAFVGPLMKHRNSDEQNPEEQEDYAKNIHYHFYVMSVVFDESCRFVVADVILLQRSA